MDFWQRENIGFEFIKSKMLPATPFGAELVKSIRPFGRDERDILETELSNLNKLSSNYEEVKSDINAIRRIFMQMKDVRGSIKFGRDNTLSDIELFEIKILLMQLEKLKPVVERVSDELRLCGFFIEPVSIAVDILDPDGRRIPTFSIYDEYSDTLKEIRKKKRDTELKMQSDAALFDELKDERLDITAKEEKEERRIREELSIKLRPYFDTVINNINTVARLDLLIEKHRVSKLYPSCLPQITKDTLILKDTTNPYICDILESKGLKFTPVSIEMGLGTTVLTGANMGGKSVTLKTVALNTYLALCGFFVYAVSASIPAFDEIIMISEESQSVAKGLSSFGAQIVELKNLLNEIENKFVFAILDEFARGTNPKEGESLVRGLVSLLNTKKTVSLLVTHFDHVAELSKSHYQVKGLQGVSEDRISSSLLTKSDDDAKITAISQFMNYGIFKVDKDAKPPKEALMICRLLGLQNELLDIL
ncbi:MutS-related protein [Lachnoanaerobaculum saburreum]|uniref:MutS domain V protein n=1 Tax=Lachnoanaerobaculum saburreum TaxID=467210 RepID=A0A134A0N5_9FIRM|nr:DNA mismatch repair protein MutS [Lachnoanaerobaculum saburreum]KXB61258.1 MutS domain V protein [Lachnoanaerobaculum saburreum]